MPPEMMTIVAPTAMIAKKLASVAVWISVYELRKLLTVRPRAGVDVRAGKDREHARQQQDDEHEPRLRRRQRSSEHGRPTEHIASAGTLKRDTQPGQSRGTLNRDCPRPQKRGFCVQRQ